MRLFVAINLPADVRQAIWEAAEPLREDDYPVKWVGPDAIHLTLKFLGQVAAPREREIVEALNDAVQGARRFQLSIDGFGAFPTADRPRVVWVGCEAAPPLELLQHRVEQEMDRLGFPVEGRAFRPHLTLGRATRAARVRAFQGMAGALAELSFQADVVVDSVDLMESRLSPKGARYVRRHGVPLVA